MSYCWLHGIFIRYIFLLHFPIQLKVSALMHFLKFKLFELLKIINQDFQIFKCPFYFLHSFHESELFSEEQRNVVLYYFQDLGWILLLFTPLCLLGEYLDMNLMLVCLLISYSVFHLLILLVYHHLIISSIWL